MKPRNAYCSFCRKSHTDVGPLVEGPDEVYICGECIELCQSIIEQERRRRNPRPSPVGPTLVRERLDKVVSGQEEAKEALVRAAGRQHEARGQVLLIGLSRSAKALLARALAYALEVPFAAGDASGLVKTKHGSGEVVPLLFSLLSAGDFDVEGAQCGVVYVDGVDEPDAQAAALRVWQGQVVEPLGRMEFDTRGVLFVCGGTFPSLADGPGPSATAEALVVAGAGPEWVSHFAAIARAEPLDEETLARVVAWVDFSRSDDRSTRPGAG